MKNFCITCWAVLVCLCVSLTAHGEMKIVPNSFKDANSADVSTGGTSMGSMNMLAMSEDWPQDADGGDNVAELLIQLKNVPMTEFMNFRVTDTQENMPCAPGDMKPVEQEGLRFLKVFIPAHSNADIDISHPEYGTVRISNKDIKKHHVYIVAVENERLVNVAITSDPAGAVVEFDGRRVDGVTPVSIPGVMVGPHEIALYAQQSFEIAENVPVHVIEVSDANTTFNYNMRRTAAVKVVSEPAGATLNIMKDGKTVQSGKSPLEAELPFGEYLVTGQLGQVRTHMTMSINQYSSRTQKIQVVDSKMVAFVAIKDNAGLTGARVNIDGVYVGQTGSMQPQKLDYGTHKVEVSYQGSYKKKKIKVDAKSAGLVRVDLSERTQFSYSRLFSSPYKRRDWGVSFSYVNRSWKMKVDGNSPTYYNAAGEEDAAESGIRLGVDYTPYFGNGHGLITGLYWQMFFIPDVEMATTVVDGWNSYSYIYFASWQEHDLYIPLQYQFRLPIRENFSVYANFGLGCAIGLSSKMKSDSDESEGTSSVNTGFGTSEGYHMPDRVQRSLPLGFGVQWRCLALDFKYSWGLNNNKDMYVVNEEGVSASCKMRTWQLGVHFVF